MSGQDVKRGTFSHRHAVIYDETTNKEYNRLNSCRIRAASSGSIIPCSANMPCSVLNTAMPWPSPNSLVLWEAQFGDFANGAQIIIDQFIASAETNGSA
jgi:2-oxoglutarate dehydrogenase E1 component